MPIRWSALKVSEAADMVEEFVNQAAEPLECARTAAREALNLPNLPQYIEQKLRGILSEIERVTGGEYSWGNEAYQGSIKRAIERLRDDIPADALAGERVKAGLGSWPQLVM